VCDRQLLIITARNLIIEATRLGWRMKRSLFCSSLPLASIGMLFLSAAQAGDEPMEALKKAQKAQLDAPASRMKVITTDDNNKTSTVTIELAQPDMLHWTTENDGQLAMEMWADGKKTYMRQGPGGEIHESPINISSLITQARQSNTLETMIAAAQDLKLVGHENVNGAAASIYTFKSTAMGLDSSIRLWISDTNNLPLKSEADTHRELKGQTTSKKSVTTFEYGPSIKIALPGR
jgi:outer membrane lipoprotein-sorting protein